MGSICGHPSMDLIDFNYSYLEKLLDNICRKQKCIFFLWDFNANLLNYNEHNQKINFYILLFLTHLRL